jgi:hypothetical protein
MKRKIKRKLFVMGMAVAAGAAGSAFAKENSKTAREDFLQASHWHSDDHVAAGAGVALAEAQSMGLYSKLKSIVGTLNYNVELPAAQIKPGAWRLGMLPSNAWPDLSEAPRPSADKRVGVALHLAF